MQECCMISQVCIMESFLIWNCLILLFHTLRVPQTCRESVRRNSIIVIINLSTYVCVMRNSMSWPRSAKEMRLTNTCRSAGEWSLCLHPLFPCDIPSNTPLAARFHFCAIPSRLWRGRQFFHLGAG